MYIFRYRGNVSSVEGYDVTVTVMPDAVHVQYSNDAEPEFTLPISTLSICAAVRCVESADDSSNMKFIPVHSVITVNEPDSAHPAMFATVMRRSNDNGESLLCYTFICNSTRDALHLVNATQTAHTALRRGYSSTGAMKFFIDQSTEFDRTLRITQGDAGRKVDSRKIYMYHEDYDTRQYNADSNTYVTSIDNVRTNNYNRVSTRAQSTEFIDGSTNITASRTEGNTYYIKAGDYRPPTPPPAQRSETLFVKADVEQLRVPTPPVQQTIYVDKPVIQEALPPEVPQTKVIEREVLIKAPQPPPMQPQVIYVDKPVFEEMKWPDPPPPKVIETEVIVQPPPPPTQEPQTIYVDKPILKDWPECPPQPPPEIIINEVICQPPQWPEQKPQKIIIDKPVLGEFLPPPPAPPPIVESRLVHVKMPEFPKQEPHRIVIEKPVFNEPKPAPPCPTPILDIRKVFIDPPEYGKQEPQRIVVEQPVIRSPPPPPPQPKPIIITKKVYVDCPQYEQPEPQRIVVEQPVLRSPPPPPPIPPPIIEKKFVYCDPEPWPELKPQRIVVEIPVFRPRPPPVIPKPIIIRKKVYVDEPEHRPIEPQRVVIENPVLRRTTYGVSETRRHPSVYNYHYQNKPSNVRGSYVVRTEAPQQQGLRRYAMSESGDDRYRSGWDYNGNAAGYSGYRIYGQPRDFREKQFMNERSFGRRINEEQRHTRGPSSYTYGDAYRVNARRESASS